jgi:hypothetical protein
MSTSRLRSNTTLIRRSTYSSKSIPRYENLRNALFALRATHPECQPISYLPAPLRGLSTGFHPSARSTKVRKQNVGVCIPAASSAFYLLSVSFSYFPEVLATHVFVVSHICSGVGESEILERDSELKMFTPMKLCACTIRGLATFSIMENPTVCHVTVILQHKFRACAVLAPCLPTLVKCDSGTSQSLRSRIQRGSNV